MKTDSSENQGRQISQDEEELQRIRTRTGRIGHKLMVLSGKGAWARARWRPI